MPKDTTAVETSAAHKVFDIPVKLEAGQINTLAFSQDSIAQMRQLPEGQLEISFRDGSKVVIENFTELVNSAQSCGRDTIIQLSDNTIIYPEELAARLAQGPVEFALATDASGAILLDEPKAGQIVEKNIEDGVEYKLVFNLSDTVSAAQAGNNLILTFRDGGVLVLNNYYTAIQSELPPAMSLADGSVIDANALLTSCKLVEIPAIAEAVVPPPSEAVAQVEPAAGIEPPQTKLAAVPQPVAVPDIEPAAGDEAAAVANIEPAAGDAGNRPASSSRGYGFGSSIDNVSLNGANPVGPIGATALRYGAEFPDPRATKGTNEVAAFVDTNPQLTGDTNAVDETGLGPNSVIGNVGVNYGDNGAGSLSLNDNLVVGGSLAAGVLSSQGVPVTVVRVGNTYTGSAGGTTVFTLVLDPATGDYVFTQVRPLDHADTANPNDLITLSFGVTASDSDTDAVENTILIGIYDDAPIAKDDSETVDSSPLTVTGSVTANDYLGHDITVPVTQVTFGGTVYAVPAGGSVTIVATYGTLIISSDGGYSYTSKNTAEGTDRFVYTVVDFDGDPSTATLSLTVTDIDTLPVVTPSIGQVDETGLLPTASVTGTVVADFKDDGPGSFAFSTFTPGGSLAGGALTSHGVPVTVTLSGGVYTGSANGVTVFTISLNAATGAYTFTQMAPLDHADSNNPNDVITLRFGVDVTDAGGDATPTTITVSVLDDAPVAVDDGKSILVGDLSVSGNVLDNDDVNNDGFPLVTAVTFGGVTTAVPQVGTATVIGVHGTLTIGANGAYTYTSANSTAGNDVFTYTMRDFDGDKATAKLTLGVADIDTIPVVTSETKTTDETNLGPLVVNGTIPVDFKADGPGTVNLTGFSVGGSIKGGELSSCGDKVTVTLSNGAYVGIDSEGETVFTLSLNPSSGAYTFTQYKGLDHADVNNPDDVISLKFAVTAIDGDGDPANGLITINVKDDGPVADNDTNNFDTNTGLASGNVITGLNGGVGADDQLSKDGHNRVTKVAFNGIDYDVPETGYARVVGEHGILRIHADGSYTYDYTDNNPNRQFTDTFTYTLTDCDGDSDTALLIVNGSDQIDDKPEVRVNPEASIVDETIVGGSGTQTVSGQVIATFGHDGPGTITPLGAASFAFSGSTGPVLSSHGFPVVVTLVGNQYIGKAGSATIFTLTLDANGAYTYTQFGPLDHANPNNPDDVITLSFGVKASDADDDSATSAITIQVHDDAPVALDDDKSVASAPGSVSGNVTLNDKIGEDVPGYLVKQVTFGTTVINVPSAGTVVVTGAHGTLTISASGAYTYNATSVGSDVFGYQIVDQDGDKASAKLTLTVTDVDSLPCIDNVAITLDETALPGGTQTVAGVFTVDYRADGPGTVLPAGPGTFSASGSLAGGMLSSKGSVVSVTLVGDTYTGKSADGRTIFTLQVKTDATYAFKLFDQLDHADKLNPDDVINLKFGVLAADSDDDVVAGEISVAIKDDGPVAVDDGKSTTDVPAVIDGNVLINDKSGADESLVLTKVAFGATFVAVPVTGTVVIEGAHGRLTISANGAYTYQAASAGVDQFSYTIVDADGDPATARLTITVNELDTIPTVQNSLKTIDETALDDSGTQTVNGTLVVDYKADGPGTTAPTTAGSFSAGGSVAGGSLKSLGSAVTVSLDGDTYIGKSADGRTIFTLQVKTDATYTFKLFDQLDHADKANPDDVIALNFGFRATDSDGDGSNGTITVNVRDDGPVAVNDINSLPQAPGVVEGTVLGNDDVGADEPGSVRTITFGATTLDIPATGTVTIQGLHGALRIDAAGNYRYSGTSVGVDQFTYKLVDADGDPTTAKLTITVVDADETPTVQNVRVILDETNLIPTGLSISGTTAPNFFGDGPGTVKATGAATFAASGSLKDGVLKSDGVRVEVSLNTATNTYEGFAGSRKVFAIKINSDGTFTFTQFDNIDHADKTNPNDEVNLSFGVTATDADGDPAQGTITVTIRDDAPIARDDYYAMAQGQVVREGNVLTNDTIGNDYTANAVTSVKFGATSYTVPNGGTATIVGTFGTLVINANGNYTYTAKAGARGSEIFTYTITDTDLDTSTAQLKLDVKNAAPPQTPLVNGEDVCVLEDNCIALNVSAVQVGGDGNEVMTVTISGFKPGWIVDTSVSGGSYNPLTGVWTITLAPGHNYSGGPTVYPPHDSDADMAGLVVKATSYDPDTGITSAPGQDSFNVVTDAVADVPVLNVDADDSLTNVANLYISTQPADTDGSEVIKEIQIGGVPDGWLLTSGVYDSLSGKWILTAAQLPGLKLIAPHDTVATIDLTVTSVVEEKNFSGDEKIFSNNLGYCTKELTVSIVDNCGCGDHQAAKGASTLPAAAEDTTSIAVISGFDAGEGDVVDLSAVIEHYDPVTQAITDFVFARSEGNDTVISVATPGTGEVAQAQDVVILEAVTGVKVEDVTAVLVNQTSGNVI